MSCLLEDEMDGNKTIWTVFSSYLSYHIDNINKLDYSKSLDWSLLLHNEKTKFHNNYIKFHTIIKNIIVLQKNIKYV